jgi:AraC-like DNA-binding protein
MNYIQKSTYEDCIPEEELPVKADIRVVRQNDPDYGLSDDEVADRNEFIRCHLAREFELLMMIPAKTDNADYFIADLHVGDDGYSAFNTVDFQRTQEPFDKYGYAMKKVMERVTDLAVLHSSISHEVGRQNLAKRFESLVELAFREPLFQYVDRYKAAKKDEQRQRLKKKIGEMNRRILEAKSAWEQYSH